MKLARPLALCLAVGGLILGIMLPHGIAVASTIAPEMACAPTGCCCLTDAAHPGERCPMAGVLGMCRLRPSPPPAAPAQAAFTTGGLPPAVGPTAAAARQPVASARAATPVPGRVPAPLSEPSTPPPEAVRAV